MSACHPAQLRGEAAGPGAGLIAPEHQRHRQDAGSWPPPRPSLSLDPSQAECRQHRERQESGASLAVGTSQATGQDAGITSAAINVFTQVGGAIGVSVAVTIFYSRSNHLTAHGHSAASSMVGGLHAAGIALIALLALHMINGLITYRGLRGAKAV